MNEILLITLSLTLMLSLAVPRRGLYGIPMGKTLLLIVYVAFSGLLGTSIMHFIENGNFAGRSFFGAVLFIPLFLLMVAPFFRIPLRVLTDFVAAPGLAMFVVNKLNCYLAGCCGGIVYRYTADGIPIFFPSQLVEMLTAAVIVWISLFLERIKWCKGRIYSICLILYGISRYILNYFRWARSAFVFGMPPGNFWSIIAVIAGCIWLTVSIKKSGKVQQQEN